MLNVKTRTALDLPTPRAHDTARDALDHVFDSIKTVEKEIAEKQVLLSQISAQLDEQVHTLTRLRQIAEALSQSSREITLPPPSVGAASQLRFNCFGPFRVHNGQVEIPLGHLSKGLMILKYLATMRQPVQRDVLMEILWPETAPHTANNRLKVAMHHLRQALASTETAPDCRDCILFGNGCYLLNPDFDIWLDVDGFERSWEAGLHLERAGRLPEAVPYYVQAEALYRGDFLEEDRLEEWTLVRREALKDTYLTILDKLSQYWFKTDHIQRAIEGWKKILAKDPWREDTYRRLMICFASRGQRAAAMRWYEVCVQVVLQQVGLEPEPETQRLYERIRSGKGIVEPREL